MRCVNYHVGLTPEATGRIRYIQRDGTEVITGPMCDRHQVEGCMELRKASAREDGIREVGAVPLDYRERMAEARRITSREDRIRALMDAIVSVELSHDLDPYPGTIQDGIADGASWQRRLQEILREHPYPQDLREAVAIALDAVERDG